MTDAPNAFDTRDLIAHAGFVRGLARSLLKDENLADDVVQETWLTAMKTPPRRPGSVKGWLGAVVRNRVRQEKRTEQRRRRRESRGERKEPHPSPSDTLEKAEILKKLTDAVGSLDRPYREAVILRYYEDLSPQEIARRLGLPHETVRTRLRRALDTLKGRLDRECGGDRAAWVGAFLPFAAGNGTSPGPEGPSRIPVNPISAVLFLKLGMVFLAVSGCVVLTGWLIFGNKDREERVVPLPPAPAPPPEDVEVSKSPAKLKSIPPEHDEPLNNQEGKIEHVVRGKVEDPNGKPLKGIVIVAEFDGGEKKCKTEDDGTFFFRFPAPTRVKIYPAANPIRFGRDSGLEPRWFETPSEDVKIVLKPRSGGTFIIRLRDPEKGKFLKKFRCAFRWGDGGIMTMRADEVELNAFLPLQENAGAVEVEVKVITPKTKPPLSKKVFLTVGETIRIDFDLPGGSGITGWVFDMKGEPVEGVLVYVGTQILARGDEPFKPFDENRIVGGTRTGKDGSFSGHGTRNIPR
ncbi:MAG: sigma-70 family RNA polymerase sigma factor [Planctomycetota bacterium]|jgi:RNA polymerase sigma-70 factor (ECF subfamily)